MIYDPALGKTKAERAFGNDVDMKGVRTEKSRSKAFYGTRMIEKNMYGAPKTSYGRYQVSEQASDILNRQLRSYNR